MSDGISMNHEGMKFSLLSRELIADSIEAVVHGLAYDALIGFGGCDKTLPGVMMGMIRCNVPSIFIYGGSALPGRFEGRTLTVLDSYEAVGGFMTGEIDAATLAGHRAELPADHRRLRRPVHRQHHGDGVGGDGADHAQRLDDPRGLRRARAGARQAGRLVMQMLAAGRALAARDRHAQGAGKRRGDRRRHRRVDQRRAASAGDRQ